MANLAVHVGQLSYCMTYRTGNYRPLDVDLGASSGVLVDPPGADANGRPSSAISGTCADEGPSPASSGVDLATSVIHFHPLMMLREGLWTDWSVSEATP